MDGIDDYKISGKAKQGDMRGILSGNVPITGTPGGMDAVTGIYGQDGNLIAGGDITSDNAFTRTNPPSPTDPGARIGDYVMQPGGAVVVPNSLTDIYQKYIAAYGGSKMRGLSFSDWANALVKGLSARMGAPTDTSNVVTTAATTAMSAVLSRIRGVRDIWGIANTISELQSAQDRYLKDWMNQEIEYDTAADFYVDDNGDLRYKPDYSKMAEAGYGSGSEVLKATDTENSDVALLEDNNLQVNVSPVFANSSAFADIKKQILEAYPNMTREIADTVVSEETGATVLDTIKQYILSQESQFYYNAKSIYDLKQVGPDASMDSLERASYTQLMGAMDKKSLENMTVTVYNRDNQMEELNAKEYLDSIKDMDDRGREEYMLSLGNRIQSDGISDDEKVVLQAQANALYMASNNDGAYKDMYRKGFWDSVADTGGILFGLRLGNMFGVDELTTFEENEFYRGSLDLVTGVGRVFTTAKIMGKLEKFGRAGLTKLGDFVGNNTFGNFLKNINTYSPQGANYRLTDIGKEVLPGNQTLTLGGFLGRTGVQVGTQAVADAAFDLGKMGVYALANEDYDFWDEFGTDFLIDTMLTYGPSAYIEDMDRPKYEYRRVGAEGDQYKAEKLEDINRRMEEDEFFDGKYQGPTGVGMYEVKLVEVTADELAKRHAQRIDKLTDTKIGRKVQELFFDKNAAMGKLATQARAAASGDTYYFRKMLRYSGDIRQLTRDVMNEYRGRDAATKVWDNFYSKLAEVAPKARDFTKADANYINAMANKTRFSAEWKGNKEAEAAINKFYNTAIKGVSAERAEQLNGLMESMRAIAADGVDFYGERGIFSKKQIRDLRKNPVYKDGMYMPVWTKGSRGGDGDIMQSRATTKSVFDPKVLISVEDLENPLVTIASYINNVARNVAINDRALAIREAASLAGVKLHILEDTGGALSEVKNLRELNDAFEKQYQNIVKSVKEAVPTRKQWQEINDKLILDSATMKSAEELDKLKQEAKDLRNELRRTKRAQDNAIKGGEDYYHRFRRGEAPEDAYVEYNPTLGTTFASLFRDFERIDVDDIVRELLDTKRGQDVFEDVALLVGHNPDAVYGEIMRRLESIYTDKEVTDLTSNDRDKEAYDLIDKKADSLFTREQREAFFDKIQEDWPAMVAASRDRMVKMYNDVQPFLDNLGIEAYTKFYEAPEEVSGGRAYGNYWFGDMGLWEMDANERIYAPTRTPQQIRISLSYFENLPGMKSVLAHEAAHAAWSKAANRIPIGQDIFRMLGVKGSVSDELAASRDFSELVAYMTQKKFISEFTNKDRKAAREFFLADEAVQHHLDNILKEVGGKQKISFKKRFIDAIRDATLFLKAKIAGARSLRNVTTFADFCDGLISGDFASDMRVDQTGSKWVMAGTYVDMDGQKSPTGDILFDWSKVHPDAEQLAADIIEIKNKISANKEAQAKLVNEIKDTAKKLMEEAATLNKYNPAKLDIQSYANVELTNNLKKALKSNDPTGQIQAVLNKAVELANPYVTRSSVINKLAEEAAYKFRKKVARDMKVVENVRGKKRVDAANDLIDKVTDEIITKVTGEKKTLTAIDDNELTRILNSNGDPHTIRYMLNGEEQKMILTGKGSEDLVKEFYAPEAKARTGIRRILNLGNKFAQAKRYLTTSADPTRVLPNLARDWSRGIVTTGGDILLSPDQLRTKALETGNYTPEQVAKINNGFELARAAVDESTFTASMQTPKKNRAKSMVRAASEPVDGNAFTRFIWDRTESTGKLMSTLQDMGETFTRRQAMEVAYYKELSNCAARGMSIEDSIKRATEAAYFYGREATVNFFRRGSLIAEIAQQVPYLSQNFASLESFKYAFLDDPIKVTRSLETTVTVYVTMIAIALSNDESRKRYYLLTEYDRAHNIIIPLANNMIVTVPLDENIAAFLTPYRRLIETLNGVDPEAFYLWGAEMLEALSPLDLSGFSEGDKFNVVRGFQKIGSQTIPTWAQPILESMTGTDWYYGSNLEVTKDDVGARTDNWDATPGELTTKSKNSEVLARVADATGIPQWVLQNIYSEYGGNVGQYMLNMIDKLAGSTEEAQGGKDFFDSIFKPFTGMDSDEVGNAFWNGINQLDDEKKQLQRELKTLGAKISAATGEEKAELQNKRQEKIRAFGVRVSDFLNQYLSAFEITGGLTKSQANRVWRLYDIYDQNENDRLYREGSPEEYFGNLASKQENKEATNLAGLSGLDKYYHTPADDYNRTYGEQMFRNTIYGQGTQHMANIAKILEDTSDYNNSFTKLRSDAINARKKAKTDEDWDNYDRIAYQYDYKVLSAIYPYLVEHGVADTLNNNEVIKYLEDWILVPSTEMRTSKGRYVPNLGTDSEKYKAFTKQFVKKMYGVSGE